HCTPGTLTPVPLTLALSTNNRRRPTSPLFPYTTLFRSLYADTLTPQLVRAATEAWPADGSTGWPSWAFSNHDAPRAVHRDSRTRSEEHTSELQSHLNLVCRRLLEKKNTSA